MYDEKVSIVKPIILLHAHSLFRMYILYYYLFDLCLIIIL